MSPVIKFAYELIPVTLWFLVAYRAFFMLHRPPSRMRRWVLRVLMGAWAFGNEFFLITHAAPVLSIAQMYVIHLTIFVVFALVCGNPRRSILTAIYAFAAAVSFDYIGLFVRFVLGGAEVFHPDRNGIIMTWDRILGGCVVWLLWTVFYCRIAKKYPAKLPLRSWLLTMLPPILSSCALIYLFDTARFLLKAGTNIYMIGLVAGIFLFLLNCFLFYWHIALLANSAEKAEWQRLMAEAQEAAQNAAAAQSRADSNWSREAGLSEAFVAKYQFSAQERRALELAVLGKADKEIAKEMGVAPSSVKTYLHRVYEKTDTYGRHGVFSLIHGGNEQH